MNAHRSPTLSATAARNPKKSRHAIRLIGAAALALAGTSAFALAPCASITNFAQLVQAGTCYTGPNNSVTFSNFVTNVSPSQQSQIGVATMAGNYLGGTGTTALLGFIFDTSRLKVPGISFSFSAQCDASCAINDGVNRVNGNPGSGSGIFNVNGMQFNAVPGGLVYPQFNPYVTNVSEYAAYTQTSVPNQSASSYEMGVNIVPTGGTSSTASASCPKQ
jgi:hypothetical protein